MPAQSEHVALRTARGEAEVEIELEEVRRLGEVDANFRRSIVSSEASLTTIAEASRQKLLELREKTGEERLKIIASALNMEHCRQIVAKYRQLGLRADFVHSKEDGKANERVHQKLENHLSHPGESGDFDVRGGSSKVPALHRMGCPMSLISRSQASQHAGCPTL